MRIIAILVPTLAVFACGSPAPPQVATGAADTGHSTSAPTIDTQPPTAIYPPSQVPVDCPENEYASWNLPDWAQRPFLDSAFTSRYEFFTRLNPFFLTGYFDGDEVQDLAVQIRERNGGRRGVAVLHRGTGQLIILGAGNSVGNGGDDWRWLWVWRVEDPDERSASARRGRQLLLVEKPESASGYLWWDGATYQWTQGSD